MGSIIQATPLIQTIRDKFPKSKLIFVSTSANKQILEHISEIDEIKIIQDNNLKTVVLSTLKFIFEMWQLKPDLFIDLEFYSNYSSIVTTLSKATNRLGFYKHNKPYRKGVYNYLMPFNVDFPISESYLQFANLLGENNHISSLKIEVFDHDFRNSIYKKTGLEKNKKYIVINPNASDLRIERRWPKESYIELIKTILREKHEHIVILIGNKTESAYVNEIESAIGSHLNLINSSGKINLSEFIYLIAHADLMVSNDTGPMHIAFAVNTKIISMFGPCSPQQYGNTNNSKLFYKKVHCSPCVHEHIMPPCHGNNICMKGILVSEIESAVFDYLP